jgi:hypothetical protein
MYAALGVSQRGGVAVTQKRVDEPTRSVSEGRIL